MCYSEVKATFPLRRAIWWEYVWLASHVTKHAATNWPGGDKSSSPTVYFAGSYSSTLSIQMDAQDHPLLHIRPYVPTLTAPTGTGVLEAVIAHPKPGSCGHPLVGTGGKLFFCSPWPLPPLWCGQVGRWRPSLWSSFGVE